MVLQLRYLEGKRVAEFRFSKLARASGFYIGALLAFSIGSKLARSSLSVVDGARSCCRSSRYGGRAGAARGPAGPNGALWGPSVGKVSQLLGTVLVG